MKIGWCRLTMTIELDFETARVGYCEMRVGWIKALLKLGHTVKVLSTFSKDTEKAWKASKEDDWLHKVEYGPSDNASDCDLLIVECSATNFMYGDKTTKQSCMRRTANIIDSYRGLVIIEQSDPDLAFPFWKMAHSKKDWENNNNPYRLDVARGRDDMEDYGWATHEEIYDGKEYLILVKSRDIDKVLDVMDGTRYGYKRIIDSGEDVKVVFAPQAYDPEFSNQHTFNENPEYDLIYAGYPRNREKLFRQYMFENPFLKKAVIGPWNKKKNKELRLELPFDYVQNVGCVPWKDVAPFINSSKTALYLGVPRSIKLDWETSRPYETVFNHSIVVYGDEARYLKVMFGEYFNVSKNEDLFRQIGAMSNEVRHHNWQEQYNYIKHQDWDWFVVELQKIINDKCTIKTRLIKKIPKQKHGDLEVNPIKMEIEDCHLEEFAKQTMANIDSFNEKIRERFEPYDCYGSYEEIPACSICPWKHLCMVVDGDCKSDTAEDPDALDRKDKDGVASSSTGADIEIEYDQQVAESGEYEIELLNCEIEKGGIKIKAERCVLRY